MPIRIFELKLIFCVLFPLVTAFSVVENAIAEDMPVEISNKKVFNFTDSGGTPVFTDRKPKTTGFKTRTIQTRKVLNNSRIKPGSTTHYMTRNIQVNNNTTVINNNNYLVGKGIRHLKKKGMKNHCKSYKARLDKVMDKMRSGYRPSEYKRLEKKRVKYRKLLFDKCDNQLNPKM